MRISDWSSDVCSSDLVAEPQRRRDTLGLAAGDGAAEHAARGVTAEIGFGQRVGDAAHTGRADRRGGERDQRFQHLDLPLGIAAGRSEEHTSELQSLMRISYAVFCLKKTNNVNP